MVNLKVLKEELEIPPPSDRPLVTFALFAYNQEKFIREAVEGAFSQAYEPLEVILSDDHSSDRTFEIMQEMAASYQGPHKIKARRNEGNIGLAAHVNDVFRESSGEILVLAAGDDISMPDRTTISVDGLQKTPLATAVLLSAYVIDDSGKIVGERPTRTGEEVDRIQTLEDLLEWNHLTFGATRAVRREVLNLFGPLNEGCPTEDTPILLRSLISGVNVLSSRKAVLYRRHENNLSNIASLKRMNMDEIYRQYRDDIRTAGRLNLISEALEQRLSNWLDVDKQIRIVRLKLAADETLSFKETIFAVRSSATVSREKIRFILAYLKQLRLKSR